MITDSFDSKTEPLVSFSHFYGEQKHLIDTCLVTFSRQIADNVLATFDCSRIAEIHAANGSVPIYQFNHGGREIGLLLTGIGSTLAAQFCIETNWLTGAEKFIMFGSAGSLDGQKTAGRFVIPTHAYRDEGMSYHYAPPADYIEIRNHGKVAEIFRELALPYVEGRVWTTDAFMRETVGQMNLRKSEGCIAVEMELAGVQAVCDHYGWHLYDFLETGDVVDVGGYDISTLSEANHDIRKLKAAFAIIDKF